MGGLYLQKDTVSSESAREKGREETPGSLAAAPRAASESRRLKNASSQRDSRLVRASLETPRPERHLPGQRAFFRDPYSHTHTPVISFFERQVSCVCFHRRSREREERDEKKVSQDAAAESLSLSLSLSAPPPDDSIPRCDQWFSRGKSRSLLATRALKSLDDDVRGVRVLERRGPRSTRV